MITNKIIPAHILRLYCWEILRVETGMETITADDGVPLIPIIPIEDEPKVNGKNKPYCIYGYAENEAQRLDQIRRGVFSLRVMAPNFAQLTRITNTVGLAFESCDIATEAVNRWSSQYPNDALEGIRFTYLKTSFIEGGEAAESEGGPIDGVVNIEFQYVNHLPIPVPASVAGGLWT